MGIKVEINRQTNKYKRAGVCEPGCYITEEGKFYIITCEGHHAHLTPVARLWFMDGDGCEDWMIRPLTPADTINITGD